MSESYDPTEDGTETEDTGGALSTVNSPLGVLPGQTAGVDDDSPVAALKAATARLKAQRAGLNPNQKIAALLMGFAQPSAHTGWQSGVVNAATSLQTQTLAAQKADQARQDLIAKYDLASAHYQAQNDASTQRTQELADAAKARAAAATAKASQGTLQVLPALYPGAQPSAVLKGFNPDGSPFVKPVPIGTPGSTPAPTASPDGSTAPVNPFPMQHLSGAELASKYGLTGYDPNTKYSLNTTGPEAGKVTEEKPSDPLTKYGITGLTGPAVLAALPANKAAEVQAILDGRILAPTTGTRAKDGAELLALATAADPAFDASVAKGKFTARQAYAPGGKAAQNFLAIDTVMNHLDKLSTDASNLNNTDVPVANAVKNAVAGATGASAPTQYNQTATAAANELMKVFRGTGQGSTKDIEEWRKTLDPNMSPDQQSGAITGALDLVTGRLKPLVDQWNQTMGENRSVLSFISPEARTTFMKLDPNYQLTPDDKSFLMQQEATRRQKTAAVPKVAPGPASASGGNALPATTVAQYAAIPMANKAAARAYLQKQGYDISGLK